MAAGVEEHDHLQGGGDGGAPLEGAGAADLPMESQPLCDDLKIIAHTGDGRYELLQAPMPWGGSRDCVENAAPLKVLSTALKFLRFLTAFWMGLKNRIRRPCITPTFLQSGTCYKSIQVRTALKKIIGGGAKDRQKKSIAF